MKRLEYQHETKRNETFELILIVKSIGPQEFAQRASMQGVMSASGARAGWRGRASPPLLLVPRPPHPRPHTSHIARLVAVQILRTNRLVDEYQFKRFVVLVFQLLHTFFFSYVLFSLVNCRLVEIKRNDTIREVSETKRNDTNMQLY